jgi:anti-sigma factor RsiW
VSCELHASHLHGYLDGELDAARAADFERHVVSCAECVLALEAQEKLRTSIQTAGLYERAPATLRQKMRREFGEPAGSVPPKYSRSGTWGWLATAAALLLATLVGWQMLSGLRLSGGQHAALVTAIVDAHLRSLQPGHLMDVPSSDQHTVKPWFDGKLDFAPPVRDFAAQGFPLQGGRLDVIRGRSVAVLVYGRRKHVINVFVWPTGEKDLAPQSGSQLGYQWIDWRKSGMELCAVSDVSAGDLSELQRLLRQ